MLQKNPLQPPRSFRLPGPAAEVLPGHRQGFVSAEDFDGTGVLAGVDPCESRYWWIPELLAPEDDGRGNGASDLQAARLASPRPPAAA
jgi:hypothetical protein